jgi:hypothetical protein
MSIEHYDIFRLVRLAKKYSIYIILSIIFGSILLSLLFGLAVYMIKEPAILALTIISIGLFSLLSRYDIEYYYNLYDTSKDSEQKYVAKRKTKGSGKIYVKQRIKKPERIAHCFILVSISSIINIALLYLTIVSSNTHIKILDYNIYELLNLANQTGNLNVAISVLKALSLILFIGVVLIITLYCSFRTVAFIKESENIESYIKWNEAQK